MKKYYPSILFILVLFCVSLLYKYQDITFLRPQSIHKWRQSDCASIALNYYQHGMNFFNPETHNLTSDGGTSGKCCTSEIPILYYAVASLYGILGYHEYIYRVFNTLLFFLGLFFLFRLLQYLLRDIFWPIALALFFFSSPVLVYYGNNYLSNSSALAFSIIGWYYFIRFVFEFGNRLFYISMAAFAIAAAFKVTALFSLVAIAGIYILELSGVKKFNGQKKLFSQHLQFLVTIISIFILIGLWLAYAYTFNKKHDCTYFSTTVFPIWDLDISGIRDVLGTIKSIWLGEYFHASALIFIIVCLLFAVVSPVKNNKVLVFSILFVFLEIIAYILLQFWAFRDHDYYTIDMYILPILIVANAFDVLKRYFDKILISPVSKIIFSFFLVFNIYYTHEKMNDRYNGWMNDYEENKDVYSITSYLREIGISSNDTIISIPDRSHASLYLMNQKGWTEYTDAKFNRGVHRYYNQDSAGIQSSIDKGAKYLILNGIKELYNKPYLISYSTNLIGHYNNVLIFDLKQRINEKLFKCNTEFLSSDKQFFIGETDSTLFESGTTQSDAFSHTGKYSSSINADSPYGMTVKFKTLTKGEIFKICVWRKMNKKSKSTLVVSNTSNKYYNNEYKILETDSNGWEKLCKIVVITLELVNDELVVYTYNPDTDLAYFDDLEITRYNSNLIK